MKTAIENLEELYAFRDLLALNKANAIKSVIPDEVQEDIDAIEAEYANREQVIADRIQDAEAAVKAEALEASATIRGKYYQVVYTKPSKIVSTTDVLRLVDRWEKTSPEVAADLRSIISISKPKTSIQARKTA